MSIEFTDRTPREIDEEYTALRRQAEDTILAQLGLDTQAEEIERLKIQETSIKKRYNKVSDELSVVRTNLRALKAERQAKLVAALNAKVSPARLSELTNMDRAALSHLKTASLSQEQGSE